MFKRCFFQQVILMAIGMLFWATSSALRCGNQIINIGDTKNKVLQACGQPANKCKTSIPITGVLHAKHKNLKVTNWTYNFGPTDFLYIVTFQNDKIIKITTEGYG